MTSASLLATGSNAQEAVRRAQQSGLALGVHLCLCTPLPPAAPAAEVATLAPQGRFRTSWASFVLAWAGGRIRLSEVDRELRAQVARARTLGANPDHLDGHQHLHVLPGISGVVAQIARDEALALRWPSELPRRAWMRRPAAGAKTALLSGLGWLGRPRGVRTVPGEGIFESGLLDEERLLALLGGLGPGVHELCAHPGLVPDQVPEEPSWTYGWQTELSALCSPRVRAEVQRLGIELTCYGALGNAAQNPPS